jgi:membrane-associated HD superfamily phosphohydrolase
MNKVSLNKNIIWYILIFIGITLGTIGIPYLFYRNQEIDINHILFFNIILLVIVFTIFHVICINSKEFFHNVLALEKLVSFFIIYIFCIFISSLFSFLPVMSWVFIPMAILFLFFSNTIIALAATYCCLFIAIFLTGTTYAVQVLYMISILISILVFSKVKKIKHYYLAVCISLSIHLALIFSYNILFLEGPLKSDTILFSILNFVINGVTLVFVIIISDIFVVRKYHTIYTQINDQEFTLMRELKEKREDLYLHAIHCAYFCDKLSLKLGLDSSLVKAGTYYKNIWKLEDEKMNESIQKIAKANKFPKPVCALLEELNTTDLSLSLSKEASLIKISDDIILMIELILKKNKNAELEIEKLVEVIIVDLLNQNKFINSTFTLHEFEMVITFFKEEKLYYDFLR